jgi:hypothetical protein
MKSVSGWINTGHHLEIRWSGSVVGEFAPRQAALSPVHTVRPIASLIFLRIRHMPESIKEEDPCSKGSIDQIELIVHRRKDHTKRHIVEVECIHQSAHVAVYYIHISKYQLV